VQIIEEPHVHYTRRVVQGQAFIAGTQQVGVVQGGHGVAVAGGASAALALDAADGRIDGRYFGAPIAQTAFGAAPIGFGAHVGFGGPNAAALALDAADGRIDGRYFGAPIAQTPFGATTAAAPVVV
jgi:outer membrane protein assembly factor BamB